MGNFENLFMLGWNLEASGLEIIHREQIASLTFLFQESGQPVIILWP